MLYRIDRQHFLTHAIDYFTKDELMHFRYLIISAEVSNLSKQENVSKFLQLWPTTEIISAYKETKDKKLMEKMYFDFLDIKTPEDEWIGDVIYKTFIVHIKYHRDLMIVCDRIENDYIDVLCKFLKKRYALECIDLNKLFSEGHIGPIYIDRKEMDNRAVDIRRIATKKLEASLETTRDGRMSILSKMDTKGKLKKLKDLGISAKKTDNLDSLLIDAWVENDEEEEED